jgi:Bacterial extracellular solute-binding proteins, family 3
MQGFRRASRRRVGASRPVVAPPADIARRGALLHLLRFPSSGVPRRGKHPAGSNVDIGIAVAGLMSVDVEWRSLDFDAIIGALQAGQSDAISSSLSYTEERDQVVDYALYLRRPVFCQRLLSLVANSTRRRSPRPGRFRFEADRAVLPRRHQPAACIHAALPLE